MVRIYYKNNSCLGNENAGYKRIFRVKTAKTAKTVKTLGGNQDVILTIPGLAGFQMKVKANSVTFPDGSRVGTLVVSPVTADKLPMAPPAGGAQFGVPAWTVQPAGTRFDPPIEVTLPNASSQPAGDNLPIVQWDHDLGQYVAMGRATVSEDGSVLITDSGSGITKAGWGGLCRYDPDKCGKNAPPPKCTVCEKLETSGDCPTGTCVPDPTKENDKIKYGVFSASGEKSVEFFFLTLRASLNGSLDADLLCCKGATGGRKPTGVFQFGGSLEASLEGPIPGFGYMASIPFGGTVEVGIFGKVAAVGQIAAEGEFNMCESKICANINGTVKLLAEVGPRIAYGTNWGTTPSDSEVSAVVGVEGGQQWTGSTCSAAQKKRFFSAYLKA